MKSAKDIILPGEQVPPAKDEKLTVSKQFKADPDSEALLALNVGSTALTKGKKKTTILTIEQSPRKYFEQENDNIIGTVIGKTSELYFIETGGTNDAILVNTDFEGATKKNRPYLEVGTLIYCRVESINKFMKTRLTCISLSNKKDWASGEAMYSELTGGMLMELPINYCKQLIRHPDPILSELKKHVSFEIAIGVNGRIWVKASKVKDIMIIVNTIKKCVKSKPEEARTFIKQISGMLSS